ncbi:MAG TPA: YfiR family protein [Sphingomonadaceae bacterium]|nr:YfiR family protein [Sphingomonadaceae bacterium]
MFPASAFAGLEPAGLGIPVQSGDRAADATARIVRAILEYSRWPKTSNPLQVCVVGPANMAAGIEAISLSDGRHVAVRYLARDGFAASAGCDAYYLGELDSGTMRRWTARAHGMPIVTITERDPQCRSEAMFCLVYAPASVSFRLNVDAVARSGVRVDPRVLRLAKGG